jgi:hypothetical protein
VLGEGCVGGRGIPPSEQPRRARATVARRLARPGPRRPSSGCRPGARVMTLDLLDVEPVEEGVAHGALLQVGRAVDLLIPGALPAAGPNRRTVEPSARMACRRGQRLGPCRSQRGRRPARGAAARAGWSCPRRGEARRRPRGCGPGGSISSCRSRGRRRVLAQTPSAAYRAGQRLPRRRPAGLERHEARPGAGRGCAEAAFCLDLSGRGASRWWVPRAECPDKAPK